MILIEVTGRIDAAGTVQTFYVATGSFVTSPTDTPASVAFEPRLIDPGTIGVHIFSDGQTGGSTRLETGEVVLANLDGGLDTWINYSFDGGAITVRSGETGAAYPAGFTTLLIGTVEAVDATWDKFIFRLRDKQWRLQLNALTVLYAGNNALPAGLEGTANDLGGKAKPKTYGVVYSEVPDFVNTSKLTYQVSNGAVTDIPAVYDSGVLVTKAGDHATSALLQAAAPAVLTYETCFAEGYFRLGTTPAGQVTADITQGAAASNRTVAQILKQLALDAGFASGEISAADVTALDTAAPQVVGVYPSPDASFLQVMDQVANSVGAWYGFDAAGVLRMGQLLAPTGTPVVTLYDFDQQTLERRPPKDNGIPIWRVVLGHSRIGIVQVLGLAAGTTAVRRAYLAEQYRHTAAEDASIKTQWFLSDIYKADTLLTVAADAATEAARRLALYKVRRDIFDVTVSIDILTVTALKLGDVVAVQLARFGLDAGRSFRLIGIRLELADNRAVLTLWG